MRGSPVYQVQQVFNTIKAYGESKHEAKIEARQSIENANLHDIGKQIGVYSYATANKYRETWIEALRYAKSEFNIKDIEKLENKHIESYLENKITSGNIKYSTFQAYAAALEKLEAALNKYANQNNTGNTYKFETQTIRQEAKNILEKTNVARAYDDPVALINAIKDPTYKTLATAQLQGGFRVNELNYISEKNFLGNNTFLVISGKGGLNREIVLTEKTYSQLKALVASSENGKFIFNTNNYRNVLKQSAITTNQEYTGSHGLRWCYAQNKFYNYQKAGYGLEQTMQKVSHDLGHSRIDITKHYLSVR